MTTPDFPNFRALCTELLAAIQLYTGLNPAASEMSSVEITEKLMDAMAATVAALATPPPEPPTVMEALAARPLLEQVARLGDCIGANTVGEIMAISSRAAAWLEANPPGQPVAIEPRGCPFPGACSCVEPATTPPEPPTSQITFNAPSPPEEVIRLDKEGFHYKGQFVADAGEAHRLMMAFLEQNTKTKPEPPTDEEIQEWADARLGAGQGDPETFGWGWRCFKGEAFALTIRAALERWGR